MSLDATSFKNGLSEIQLLDIEGPTGNAVCRDAEGLRWPAGYALVPRSTIFSGGQRLAAAA